jgi:hypothetical protein
MKIICLALLVCCASALYSDVMYEMVTTSEGVMGMKSETNMRIFVKGDRSRTEMTAADPKGGTMTDTKIVRLDKNVIWSIDHENHQYSETKMTAETQIPQEQEEEIPMPELKVTRTGETKEILNRKCEEVIVTMKVEDEEGATTFKQTMWVTQDVPGYKEIQNFHKQMTGAGSPSASMMGTNKKIYDEFQEKTAEIEGFPLEMDMEMIMDAGGMSFSFLTHSIVTNIETQPISDKVFEIPADYSLK